jgi:mannitol/fructose-specific phosphotransferase system IIA component (Ntr-type)
LHARNPEAYLFESLFIVLGRTRQQVPFGAPDGKSTDLFFLIACPDDQRHLHTLARLCLILQRTLVLCELRKATDVQSMFDCLIRAEQAALQR